MRSHCWLQTTIWSLLSSGCNQAGVRDSLQLLEGQADRYRLEGVEVVHHQLAPLCQDHDGCWVFILVDGGLGWDLGPALHAPKPRDAVALEIVGLLILHARLQSCQMMQGILWPVVGCLANTISLTFMGHRAAKKLSTWRLGCAPSVTFDACRVLKHQPRHVPIPPVGNELTLACSYSFVCESH